MKSCQPIDGSSKAPNPTKYGKAEFSRSKLRTPLERTSPEPVGTASYGLVPRGQSVRVRVTNKAFHGEVKEDPRTDTLRQPLRVQNILL
jgi:hypothetical protein